MAYQNYNKEIMEAYYKYAKYYNLIIDHYNKHLVNRLKEKEKV